MRIGTAGFVSACFLLLLFSAPVAHAGLFGYSELGIIKKSKNSFLFVAADGDTVDEASLRNAILRTAKILGFTYFIFEPVLDKPAPKVKAPKNNNADAEPVAEEPKPVTQVMVYFYNSPRTRNGVKSTPLSDIDPDHIEPAPAVEEVKPAPKKQKEAAPQEVTPVVEPAPVVAVEPPSPKKKKNEAAPQDVTPVVEPAPVVAVEAPAPKKKKKEVAPQEVTPVVEPAPVVAVEAPAPKKKKKEVAPQEVTPVVEPAPVVAVEAPAPKKKKKEVAPQEVTPVIEPAPVVAVEAPAPQPKKPRARRYILPGDIEQTPEGNSRTQDLGDLFN